MKQLTKGICLLVELTSIALLTGIALKRNKDCYDAQMELADVQLKCNLLEFENEFKRMEINALKAELNDEEEES